MFGKSLTQLATLLFLAACAIAMLRTAIGKRYWIAKYLGKLALFIVGTISILFVATLIGIHGWWVRCLAVGLASPIFVSWQKRSHPIPISTTPPFIGRLGITMGKRRNSRAYDLRKVSIPTHDERSWDSPRIRRKAANRRKSGHDLSLGDWIRIWWRRDKG
jgi:hypothetical protein